MLFKSSPEKFWNLIAKKYAASPISDKAAYETKFQKVKSLLTSGQTVLDIGCGTGTQCGDIAKNVAQVTGIDISDKLLTIARQRMAERKLDNVEFLQTNLFDARLLPGSFDVVMAFYVLHLIQDTDAVLGRIYDLLKPGGVFISETACLGEKSKLTAHLLQLAGKLGLIPTINILTTRQLEQTLAKTGFRLMDKLKFSHRPDAEFTLFAMKPEK